MGLSQETVEYLRGLEYDAVHLREQGLQRMEDADILAKARRESRIVLAHDLDFSTLLAASGAALPSVVLFRLQDMRPANVNRHLRAVLEAYREALLQGAVVSVTEGRIRLRLLPIGRKR